MNEGAGEVRIVPPVPGSCRICAVFHDPDEPHDRDSLYYQNWFRKLHKRFPTWEDAMSHCSEEKKAEWKKMLARQGAALPQSK